MCRQKDTVSKCAALSYMGSDNQRIIIIIIILFYYRLAEHINRYMTVVQYIVSTLSKIV